MQWGSITQNVRNAELQVRKMYGCMDALMHGCMYRIEKSNGQNGTYLILVIKRARWLSVQMRIRIRILRVSIQYSTTYKMGFSLRITNISIWRRQSVKGALFYMFSIGLLNRMKRVASNGWQMNESNKKSHTLFVVHRIVSGSWIQWTHYLRHFLMSYLKSHLVFHFYDFSFHTRKLIIRRWNEMSWDEVEKEIIIFWL